MTAAVDVWCELVNTVEDMYRDSLIDKQQCNTICDDLKQAMWHSGNPYKTTQALIGVAQHFGLPIPDGAFDHEH
jgi:hypothetical protein